jgi:hypothetical protein
VKKKVLFSLFSCLLSTAAYGGGPRHGGIPPFIITYADGFPGGDNNYNQRCTANCSSGPPFTGVANAMMGDTPSCAWSSSPNLLCAFNDTYGPNYAYYGAGGANLDIVSISGSPTNSSWVISAVNQMTDFGTETQLNSCNASSSCWTDNNFWKATGMINLGTFTYLAVGRQNISGTNQPSMDSSIVKTNDGGVTWCNPAGHCVTTGAAPNAGVKEFAGTNFGAPAFVDYGMQSGACPASNPDNCNTYVYATSQPCSTNCNTMYVGRALIGDDLTDPTKWSFVTGFTGLTPTWGVLASAIPIFTYTGNMDNTALIWVDAIQKYVKVNTTIEGFSGAPTHSHLSITTCDHPWSPCRNYSVGFDTVPKGYYGMNVMSKWSNFVTGVLVLMYAGDYTTSTAAANATLYMPTIGRLTITQ